MYSRSLPDRLEEPGRGRSLLAKKPAAVAAARVTKGFVAPRAKLPEAAAAALASKRRDPGEARAGTADDGVFSMEVDEQAAGPGGPLRVASAPEPKTEQEAKPPEAARARSSGAGSAARRGDPLPTSPCDALCHVSGSYM